MPREVEHTPDETSLLNKFARLKSLQESASASKQAAVESDEEARRRRRELAVKALKKSLALAGEKGEIRGSTAAVEQARPPATQEAAGSSRQAVTPQVFQKVQSSGTAQASVSEATTASRGVTRTGQTAGSNDMKKKSIDRDEKPQRVFPGKEEVVYDDDF